MFVRISPFPLALSSYGIALVGMTGLFVSVAVLVAAMDDHHRVDFPKFSAFATKSGDYTPGVPPLLMIAVPRP